MRREIELGQSARDLAPADHLGFDAQMLVHLGAPAHGAQRGVGVGQREVAALGIHEVEVELVGQARETAATDSA